MSDTADINSQLALQEGADTGDSFDDGRNPATALLRRVFWEFQRRGLKHVDLKVELDNPTGAVRLYKELGMREVALDGS